MSFRRLSIVYCVAAALLLTAGGPMASSQEIREPAPADAQIRRALDVLSHLPTGKSLLTRAQGFWGLEHVRGLADKFKWGAASKTDAVLTRHFNPQTGAEQRERQVTIYLRRGQGLDDLVLDIAHELVHATSQPAWDPYDPRLTAGRYIWAAIEGEGGEVQAVAMECRVSFEMHEHFGAGEAAVERCRGYLASQGLSIDRIRRDFYRVGRWNHEISDKLGAERARFPLLSGDAPKLYSSTGNAPYPVALYREFEEITQIACENSRKRAEAAPDRTPASLQKNAVIFVAKRCDKDR